MTLYLDHGAMTHFQGLARHHCSLEINFSLAQIHAPPWRQTWLRGLRRTLWFECGLALALTGSVTELQL